MHMGKRAMHMQAHAPAPASFPIQAAYVGLDVPFEQVWYP
jgi:hypothetical protein